MIGMEKMLASMLGMTPEAMAETSKRVQEAIFEVAGKVQAIHGIAVGTLNVANQILEKVNTLGDIPASSTIIDVPVMKMEGDNNGGK